MKNINNIKKILFLLIFLPSPFYSLFSDTIVLYEAPDKKIQLDEHITIYKGQGVPLSIDEIDILEKNGQFARPRGGRINQGISDTPVWVSFNIENRGRNDIDLILTSDDASIDDIRIYTKSETDSWNEIISLEGHKRGGLNLSSRKTALPVMIPAQSNRRFFIRVYSPYHGNLLAFTIYSLRSFLKFERMISLLSGALFGSIILFAIHFMKLAWKLRDKTELWYVGSLLIYCDFYAIQYGYIQSILPGAASWVYNLMMFSFLSLCFFSSINLFRHYIGNRTLSRRTNALLKILQWSVIAYVPVVFLKGPLALITGVIIYTAIPLVTFHISIRLWLRGSRQARFFTIGWLGYTSLFLIYLLAIIGGIPWMKFFSGFLPLAILWSLIFFPDAIIWKIYQYKNQSTIDGLTGLSNRRFFDSSLEREWSLCRRTGNYLALIMIDIDWFKSYNDAYGHPAGDQCLRDIASLIHKSINRTSDNAFRYGGEEVTVLLSATDEKGVENVAGKILEKLHTEGPLRHDQHGPRVTVSMGLCALIPPRDMSASDLVQAADKALYRAKSQGRDQYCFVSETECNQVV